MKHVTSMLLVATNTTRLLYILSCQRYVSALAPTQALGSCVSASVLPDFTLGTSDGQRRLITLRV